MNFSFWEHDSYFKNIDVLIVGSGIVGLFAALHLKEQSPKLKVVVIERGFIPSGASTKNAGFACFGSVSELLDDLSKTSELNIRNLVQKRFTGLQKLRQTLGDKTIDYKNWGGYELFDDSIKFSRCEENLKFLNKLVEPITNKKQTYSLSDKKIKAFGFKGIHHLIFNSEEGQIDTGKAMQALIKRAHKAGVIILNGLNIKKINAENVIRPSVLSEDNFEIQAKQIIITINGFAKELLPELSVNPARAQVLITKPISNLKIKGTFHYDSGYYYFRNIGNRLLLGGGRNLDFKSEETTQMEITSLIQNKLDEMLHTKIIPNVEYEVEHRWSGIMGVGDEKTPIVKAISNSVFCAVRMGGMGIAIGSMVGEEVAQMALESKCL